ncbi:hypothetical protein [Nitrospirillum pindoramense]|uniref:Uncharacterized protein n=1 Tax=Nitrospirillum amazonense TaxID=28077 RepID=A0A560HDN7_9PROT|nr:hypothetical protein [Nitrospirillum amazonense]TWB44515.1 hypothetical protein FBZ90_103423 [Nitrospirillum amazonense]
MASVPLAPSPLPAPLERAAAVHHRLVEAFIRLTQDELARQPDEYARDSLNELLDVLKGQRVAYTPGSQRLAKDPANESRPRDTIAANQP